MMIKNLYAQFILLINLIKYTRSSQNNACIDKCCYYCEADIVDGIKFDQKDTAQTKKFYENFMDYINFNSLEPNLLSIFCINNSKPNTTNKRRNTEPENNSHRTKKFKTEDKTLNLGNAIDFNTNGTTSVNNATKNNRVEPENKKYLTYICNLCRKKLNIDDSFYSNHQKLLIHHSKNKILKIDPSLISDPIHLNNEFTKANNNFINSFVQTYPEKPSKPLQKQDEKETVDYLYSAYNQDIKKIKALNTRNTINSQRKSNDLSKCISQKSSKIIKNNKIKNNFISVYIDYVNSKEIKDNALGSSAKLHIPNQNHMNTSDLKDESGINVSFEKLDDTFVSIYLKNAKSITSKNITKPEKLIDIKFIDIYENNNKKINFINNNILEQINLNQFFKNFNNYYAKHLVSENKAKEYKDIKKINLEIESMILNASNNSIQEKNKNYYTKMSKRTKYNFKKFKISDEIIFEKDDTEANSILQKINEYFLNCPEDTKNEFEKIVKIFENKEQEAMKQFFEFYKKIRVTKIIRSLKKKESQIEQSDTIVKKKALKSIVEIYK